MTENGEISKIYSINHMRKEPINIYQIVSLELKRIYDLVMGSDGKYTSKKPLPFATLSDDSSAAVIAESEREEQSAQFSFFL